MSQGVTIQMDEVSFQLKEKHDFSCLQALGTVCHVFDQQDSGNISFGIMRNGRKQFIKYAGAKTIHFDGEPRNAIARLKQAVPLYQTLAHEHLVTLQDHFELEHGYAVVFDWQEGECLHPHWSYPPPDKYEHPDSPFYRFKQLPVQKRLQSLSSIFTFHELVEEQEYIAIDFYDGSILYDFTNDKTTICDIDYYELGPLHNEMGRMFGSKRFMSPEEFEPSALIDKRTNVFRLGATAFCLLGGELDRSINKWEASTALWKVACKAVSENKDERYSTVQSFITSWNQALEESL
ncbi:serine/threonine protein kinase [Alkalihalobacillus sp. FSL R5-0424]